MCFWDCAVDVCSRELKDGLDRLGGQLRLVAACNQQLACVINSNVSRNDRAQHPVLPAIRHQQTTRQDREVVPDNDFFRLVDQEESEPVGVDSDGSGPTQAIQDQGAPRWVGHSDVVHLSKLGKARQHVFLHHTLVGAKTADQGRSSSTSPKAAEHMVEQQQDADRCSSPHNGQRCAGSSSHTSSGNDGARDRQENGMCGLRCS
mmetsp:Transcript_5819/g.13559  ORF Transcript_5819/g.13559 Transcript_5819/m.13559 type:complete len:204 (-) Transcript_5819:35-646(-)